VVAAWGSSAAKAELRSRLVTAAVFSRAAHPSHQEGPGSLAALAGPGLDALDIYVGRCLPDFVLAAAAPAALLVALGVIDWVSALIALAVLALFPVFGGLVGRASLTLGADRWRRVEELGAYVADVFEGMPVLRAFGRSTAQRDRIDKLNEALARSSTKALRVAFLSALVLDELGSLSVALVAVPLGLRLLSGGVSLASALAVLAVSPEVFAPLRRASAEFHESTEGLAAAARALEAAGVGEAGTEGRHPMGRDGSPTRHERSHQKQPFPDPSVVPVELRSVRVVLPGCATPLLDGASLTIQPGETVALVGPSGSGKSTIISLLAGFLSPSEGAVSVGGVDLRKVDPRRWRRLVTYLPEHPTLLSATLAANLRLAAPGASDEELLSALAQAGAPALAGGLPGGLETQLGEGGRRLSAGELQRVGLARVLLRPASLYLLDEPTVHLDEVSEQEALAGLQKAIGDASALIVSHHPAVALAADRVVSLQDGRLIEVARADMLTAVPA
jgi:ABC-type transport system involved in cytochrome bd biosynthesis fused ATPase/permease subunit